MKQILIFLFSIITLSSYGQKKFTISGYVKDALSGENQIGAIIRIAETGDATITNDYGFYSITLPEGRYTIKFSYLGYSEADTLVNLNADVRLNILMHSKAHQINEVIVTGEKKDENVQSTDVSRIDLSINKIKTLPVLLGEVDILKTIQLLPGVQGSGEGSSGFNVRGGDESQNLILLDDAPVYNPGHLFGFFSIFNGDAILNATLYKGGIPANYGGRLSSVLDVSMKEGNNQNFEVSGGIGLIASRLLIQGPIKKNKSSFIVSGRRTYIDVLLKPIIQSTSFAGTGYYFYDLNAKMNYIFNDNNRLYISGYFGRDVFTFNNSGINLSIPWGNATLTARWNHLFSNKLFMNAAAIYNDYHFSFGVTQSNFGLTALSGIHDLNAKADFNYTPTAKHQVQFGGEYTYHTFQPSTFSGYQGSTIFSDNGIKFKYAHEADIYALDNFSVTPRLQVNAGIRGSMFMQIGPYTKVEFAGLNQPVDTLSYSSGQPIKTYFAAEPRISFRYKLDSASSIKAAFTITDQYIHLVSNNGTTLPTDVWVPSSLKVKPEVADEYSLGYFRNFADNTYASSVEIYYKKLFNQIEFKDGYTPAPNEDLEDSFVFGTGDSYGVEFYFTKQEGSFTGWVSYTLSWTNRQFPDLNNGQSFPARYDRRHDLAVVGSYKLNDRWTFGATFVFTTGIAFTPPIGKYFIDGLVVPQYAATNSFRLPAYNRLDLSATLNGKMHKKFQDSWTFAIYNVYNRQNVYFLYPLVTGQALLDPVVTVEAREVSVFPIIPSVTWNFKF